MLATGGDTALGGDDFDHAVADWILQQAGVSEDLAPGEQRELLKIACDAKERLSVDETVQVAYAGWAGELHRERSMLSSSR